MQDLPIHILTNKAVITNAVYGIYDAPLWSFSILSSKIHLVWIATICGQQRNSL
ncbi:type IIL restriction-modification enzyme MmeI [Acinetobacter indicus]